MSRYEKVSPNAFKEMTYGAGIILSDFDPATGTINLEDILFATTGGHSSNITREMTDMGEGVDNVPLGAMQLQKAQPWQIETSGTAKTINLETLRDLFGNADIVEAESKIELRNHLKMEDFKDIWIVSNYSDFNGETAGGYVAQHFMNALSMDGFTPTFAKDENGTFPFRYKAFYDINDIDKVPYEVYLKAGKEEAK